MISMQAIARLEIRGLTCAALRRLSRHTDDSGGHFSNLSQKSYWDQYYKRKKLETTNGTFEWFVGFGAIQHQLDALINKHAIFLDLGCGASTVTLQIAQESKFPLTCFCVDYSAVAVEQLKNYYTQHAMSSCNNAQRAPSVVHFVTADGTNLPFKNDSVDIVFDKGTTDAALKDIKHDKELACRIVIESMRVLRTDGVIVQISDEDPDIRLMWLQMCLKNIGNLNSAMKQVNFTSLNTDGDDSEYFAYFVKKL